MIMKRETAFNFWFQSEQFQIQEGEEELTNPGCLGKSLAEWLVEELAKSGYQTELIAEDWGWCVMCERGDYLLWVGCCNAQPEDIQKDTLKGYSDSGEIVWNVNVSVEIPFYHIVAKLKNLTGLLDIQQPRLQLAEEVRKILEANNNLRFCEEP